MPAIGRPITASCTARWNSTLKQEKKSWYQTAGRKRNGLSQPAPGNDKENKNWTMRHLVSLAMNEVGYKEFRFVDLDCVPW